MIIFIMLSINNLNYQSIKIRACRVCLDAECRKGVLLDGEDGWRELLEFCIGIKMNVQEKSQILCVKCANNLWSFAEFKKQCLKSDSLWKSLAFENVHCCIEKYDPGIEVKIKDHLDKYEKCSTNIDIREICNDDIEAEIRNRVGEYDKHTDNTNVDIKYNEKLCNTNNTSKNYICGEDAKTPDEGELKSLDIPRDDYYIYDNKFEVIHSAKDEIKSEAKSESNDFLCSKDDTLRHNYKIKLKRSLQRKESLKAHGQKLCLITTTILKKDKRKYTRRTENPLVRPDFLCGLCRYSAESQAEVYKHFEEHVTRNDLECKICEFVGEDFAQMVAHRLSHKSKEYSVKHSCPVCKKTCKSKLTMEYHYRSMHLNKPGGRCFRCDQNFSAFTNWRYHVRAHAGNKFVCDICGKEFLHRKLIKCHLLIHSKRDNYICDLCGRGFKRLSYLRLHVNTVHDNEGVKCTHCNKLFKNTQSLKGHMKRLETKSFLKCEYCGKCFSTPRHLKLHRFWHSDEKPYSCNICGALFKAKAHLKIHVQNHAGIKPFACELCNKCFPTKRHLKRHASVHTGIRPHKCMHCERTFYGKKQMQTHCEMRHKLVEQRIL